VAHGSERVIDEIREHAYQISVKSNDILFIIITFSFVDCMFSNLRLTVLAALNLFSRHCQTFNILTLVGGIREIMCDENLRVLYF